MANATVDRCWRQLAPCRPCAQAQNEEDQSDADPPQYQRGQKHHAGADEEHHEMREPRDRQGQPIERKEQRQRRGDQ